MTHLPAPMGEASTCEVGCESCAREILAGDEQDRELLELRNRVQEFERARPTITFVVPLKAESAANLREHWARKAKRVARERAMTVYRTPRAVKTIGPFLRVTLTRRAPRALDDDNLRPALKAFRDAIASQLRVDDRSPLVEWAYGQEKGEAAVLIRVEVLGR